MSRRARSNVAEAPGQDSFLDVVANLVGIFLILIIIVGSQAKSAVHSARAASAKKTPTGAPSPSIEEIELQEKAKLAQLDARETMREIESLQQKLAANQFELGYRRKELEQSTTQMQLAKKQLEQEQSRLSEAEQDSINAQVELKGLQDQLESLRSESDRMANTPANIEVVENYPSPKVRKSSVDEVEFRLKGGRLMHIPMLQLQKDVLRDVERAARDLQKRDEITRSVGPLRGFKVHYRIYLEDKEVIAANGSRGVLRKPEVDMKLEPVLESGGELVDDAIAPNSELNRYLREHPAETATVTLWVYPDSFGQFRKLRDALYKQGYLVAARPLPEGELIGCSTKGSRSMGQ
jgi:hypothetical protein